MVVDDLFDPEALDAAEKKREEERVQSENEVVELLSRRRQAYTRVFTPGERTQGDIDIVLFDLMYFCRVASPTYDIEDGIHANTLSHMKEGRREVYMRIRDFSALDLDAILLKYTSVLTK